MALIRDVKLRRAVYLALAKAVEHGWEYDFYPLENVPEEILYVVESDNIRKLECNLSDFRKCEVDGQYQRPRRSNADRFRFDTSCMTEVQIGCTEQICYDFGLLEHCNSIGVSQKYQIADIALRYVGFKARGPYTGLHNMLE